MNVRPLQKSDLGTVAHLHRTALPDDFLPALGQFFLKHGFYYHLLNNPYARVFIAEDADGVGGFAVAAFDPNRYLGWIMKRSLFPGIVGGLKLVLSPKRLFEAFSILRTEGVSLPAGGEIAFIAVDPKKQGRGFGQALMTEADELFKKQGLALGYTKTLKDNLPVYRLNKKRNASICKQLQILGKQYVYLSWKLAS